jgi:hypothetical protein
MSSEYPVYRGMRTAGPVLLARGAGFIVGALLLPIYALVGVSLAGWAVGMGLFAANWAAALGIDRFARGKMQVTAVGITGVGLVSRTWITFGALMVFAKMVDAHVGVVAAITFLIVFTVDFLARTISQTAARHLNRPTEKEGPA